MCGVHDRLIEGVWIGLIRVWKLVWGGRGGEGLFKVEFEGWMGFVVQVKIVEFRIFWKYGDGIRDGC